jgi:hypothetical protein
MALIRGTKSKRPCPICLIDGNELADITKRSVLRTALDTQQLLQEARQMRRVSDREKLLSEHGIRDVDVSDLELYYA